MTMRVMEGWFTSRNEIDARVKRQGLATTHLARRRGCFLDALYLLPDRVQFRDALRRSEAEDEEEAIAGSHVQVRERHELPNGKRQRARDMAADCEPAEHSRTAGQRESRAD